MRNELNPKLNATVTRQNIAKCGSDNRWNPKVFRHPPDAGLGRLSLVSIVGSYSWVFLVFGRSSIVSHRAWIATDAVRLQAPRQPQLSTARRVRYGALKRPTLKPHTAIPEANGRFFEKYCCNVDDDVSKIKPLPTPATKVNDQQNSKGPSRALGQIGNVVQGQRYMVN